MFAIFKARIAEGFELLRSNFLSLKPPYPWLVQTERTSATNESILCAGTRFTRAVMSNNAVLVERIKCEKIKVQNIFFHFYALNIFLSSTLQP